MSGESGNCEGSAQERAVQRSQGFPAAGREAAVFRSASFGPLLLLYQQAWEWAQRMDLSLEQLQRTAEAAALADAIRHLLAEAGDLEGQERWTVRLSEAKQWLAAVHDGLTQSGEMRA